MVKGFTAPDPMQLDLMRTWSATPRQVLSKLRWPSAVPYLFAGLKVAVTISLIGAIVAELPTGAEAGLGARLLAGSYYGQTIQIWSALLASAILASGLIGLVGLAERGVARQMGHGLEPARLRLGFILATAGMLLALVLPLSTGAAATLPARPILFALTLAAAVLFAVAAWTGGWRAIAPASPVRSGCRDHAGLAARSRHRRLGGRGFWVMMLAVWLGAALCVIELATMGPRRGAARRTLNLAIPLLFGAAVFYLWKCWCAALGFPRDHAAAECCRGAVLRILADAVPRLRPDFRARRADRLRHRLQRGLLVAIVAQRFAFLGRGLLPLGNSSRRCRWSGSRRSW